VRAKRIEKLARKIVGDAKDAIKLEWARPPRTPDLTSRKSDLQNEANFLPGWTSPSNPDHSRLPRPLYSLIG
jgi:hypothetical protein